MEFNREYFSDLLTGQVDAEVQGKTYQDFFEQGVKIREKLGERAYMVDYFIQLYFESLTHYGPAHILSEGIETAAEIKSAEKLNDSDPRLAKYIESQTRLHLRMCAGISDHMAESTKEYVDDLQHELYTHEDTQQLCDAFHDVCKLLGDDKDMVRLLDLLSQRFQAASLMAIFWQGANYQTIVDMLGRDQQSGRCVFQLLMDDVSLLE